jgi:hypothetical protein
MVKVIGGHGFFNRVESRSVPSRYPWTWARPSLFAAVLTIYTKASDDNTEREDNTKCKRCL